MPDDADLSQSPRRQVKSRHFFTDLTGQLISLKGVAKVHRDVLVYHHGTHPYPPKGVATAIDVEAPLARGDLLQERDATLQPGPRSPICLRCGLDQCGAKHPYFKPTGPASPLITIVLESVSPKEDARGELASDGVAAFMAKIIDGMAKDTGVSSSQVRWSPLTRCAARQGKRPNYQSKGNHCRAHLVQDLLDHPPRLIIPVGSTALGMLSHKSSAQDWGGRLLTYRGWPDDWLTDPAFALPRPDPRRPDATVVGHPLFGPIPNTRIPMVPLQSPRIIYGSQNPQVILRWKRQLRHAIDLAISGVKAATYTRPWYRVTEDPDEIEAALRGLTEHPGTLVAYDTETTGLLPWAEGAAIVFMMFRWERDGQPRSIGFPWDFGPSETHPSGSPILPHIPRLAPVVVEALRSSVVVGHNITFDALFTVANVPGADIESIIPSMRYDTWHMCYTMRQQRGSLGLEVIAYDYAPDLAGYEEDMTLLIELHRDLLHPGEGKGGHYANCPRDKWESHLVPYVMGDVEVAMAAQRQVQRRLEELKSYKIPLAHPGERGRFRLFRPMTRAEVYQHTISPAARLLMKMMARGMKIDLGELANQEDLFPKKLLEAREQLRQSNSKIVEWCRQQEATEPNWVFDLEKTDVLRDLLFHVLQFPVERLTDAGVKIYGEEMDGTIPQAELLKYAKVDKFTLNRMAVTNPSIRPLLEYRKLFKQYSAYVRPMRNAYFEGLDKKARDKHPNISRDGYVHAQFLLTGTRSGRLSSASPNLQQLTRDSVVKRLYISRFGERGYLYQGDLSQIELRLIAAACGDESMVGAYVKGIDLHSLTMSRIFKLPYEECTKDHQMWLQKQGRDKDAKQHELRRKIGKSLNFLTGYGGGAYGFQAMLANDAVYYEIEECEHFLNSFFDSYPSLREYLAYYKRFIADTGVAVSISGRVRVFEEVFSDSSEFISKALRAGCNHLIQATASDMMLICMGAIEGLMRQEGMESILVSTVHDSLVIDAVREELPAIHELVMWVFNNIPEVLRQWLGPEADLSWLIVPFSGDCAVGRNYLDTRNLPAVNVDWDEVLSAIDKVA
jgi:DNA polymerase I-like protein with 3'-5' exonuclease and polymerase domains